MREMDIHFFRDRKHFLRDGERFFHFDSHNFMTNYSDDSTSLSAESELSKNGAFHWEMKKEGEINGDIALDDVPESDFSENDAFHWEMEKESEINGDIALVPVSSNCCDTVNIEQISESPPCKDDFQKIMTDWQQFISLDTGCEEYPIDDPIIIPEVNYDVTFEEKNSPFHEILNLPSSSTFDITSYINEEPKPAPSIPVRKPKAGVKKIDLKAQKYIVEEDDDDVDVETISESENSPVLEAGDLDSLLEQFEATEMPEVPFNFLESNSDVKVEYEEVTIKQEPLEMCIENNFINTSSIKCKPEIVKVKKEHIEKDVVKIKKEATVDVKSIKKELKIDTNCIKKERKVETQKEVCKVKHECKPIKMELVPAKIEHANPPEKKEHKTEYSIGSHAPTISTTIKSSNDKLPPAIPKHEKSPPQSIPSKKSKPTKILQPPKTSTESTTSVTLDSTKNKQIMDSLPEELIARIKECGKRKTISVIPPFPNKKRGGARAQEAGPQLTRNNKSIVNPETVQLDHDYCSSNSQQVKRPKKDSGFESGEEDDRAIMRKQPMVKNADGKLMVSLLKVNTIRNTDSCQKKKLNLEEYKKRREGFLKSQGSSQNCSPISSTCSSPVAEDENTRRIKHQEKLMKMAMEVLNTPPKSERKSDPPLLVTPPQAIQIPSDMEKKTLVSIGINTDFKICKTMNPVTPVEQLEEIKPLLKKASAKINCNSLITSLIENIPKVINKSDPKDLKAIEQANKLEHGEDKTIVYLPKNRTALKTNSVEVQTNISLIQQSKRSRYRRRRTSSSSSSSSSTSCDSRKSRISPAYNRRPKQSDCSSGSSRSSRTSRSESFSSSYSSRSSSPLSRSRSRSPRCTRRERERLREVEERRVIYVGRISSNTSREDLRKRFQRFGPITNVSLHFRDHGDNYGFVTFANKLDAYEAIEHGNDDPYHPKYDLSFGGRRIFCKTTYSDLDNMRDETTYFSPRVVEDSFDTLLREAQEKLRKRKA